jgi:hypothetical protein
MRRQSRKSSQFVGLSFPSGGINTGILSSEVKVAIVPSFFDDSLGVSVSRGELLLLQACEKLS